MRKLLPIGTGLAIYCERYEPRAVLLGRTHNKVPQNWGFQLRGGIEVGLHGSVRRVPRAAEPDVSRRLLPGDVEIVAGGAAMTARVPGWSGRAPSTNDPLCDTKELTAGVVV